MSNRDAVDLTVTTGSLRPANGAGLAPDRVEVSLAQKDC
jgi:hypothetical protein